MGEEKRRCNKITTFSQRKLLIETYLKTGNITQSSRKAGVAINTFRRWYPRYLENGLEGIRKTKKSTQKDLGSINKKYKDRIIYLKKKHPLWGRRTIALIICRENNDKKIISPSGVQKILKKAGLWEKEKKSQDK